MARNQLIQLRRDIAATWTSVNPILALGEKGLETDTGKEKNGDGVKTWTALAYIDDAVRALANAAQAKATGALSTKVASYALTASDDIVVFNAAALTATLLDPTLAVVGQKWVVKNINVSALTVVSAGVSKLINGAASQSLAQWAAYRYASDGTQWLTLS